MLKPRDERLLDEVTAHVTQVGGLLGMERRLERRLARLASDRRVGSTRPVFERLDAVAAGWDASVAERQAAAEAAGDEFETPRARRAAREWAEKFARAGWSGWADAAGWAIDSHAGIAEVAVRMGGSETKIREVLMDWLDGPEAVDLIAGIGARPGHLVDDGTRLQCHVCGLWFRALGLHVRRHGMSSDGYRAAFGLADDVSLSSEDVTIRAVDGRHGRGRPVCDEALAGAGYPDLGAAVHDAMVRGEGVQELAARLGISKPTLHREMRPLDLRFDTAYVRMVRLAAETVAAGGTVSDGPAELRTWVQTFRRRARRGEVSPTARWLDTVDPGWMKTSAVRAAEAGKVSPISRRYRADQEIREVLDRNGFPDLQTAAAWVESIGGGTAALATLLGIQRRSMLGHLRRAGVEVYDPPAYRTVPRYRAELGAAVAHVRNGGTLAEPSEPLREWLVERRTVDTPPWVNPLLDRVDPRWRTAVEPSRRRSSASWERIVAECELYVARNGSLDGIDGDAARRLAHWRNRARSGELRPWHLRLDELDPTWRTSDRERAAHAALLGRAPVHPATVRARERLATAIARVGWRDWTDALVWAAGQHRGPTDIAATLGVTHTVVLTELRAWWLDHPEYRRCIEPHLVAAPGRIHDDGERVQCQLCGMWFPRLGPHLSLHDLDGAAYRGRLGIADDDSMESRGSVRSRRGLGLVDQWRPVLEPAGFGSLAQAVEWAVSDGRNINGLAEHLGVHPSRLGKALRQAEISFPTVADGMFERARHEVARLGHLSDTDDRRLLTWLQGRRRKDRVGNGGEISAELDRIDPDWRIPPRDLAVLRGVAYRGNRKTRNAEERRCAALDRCGWADLAEAAAWMTSIGAPFMAVAIRMGEPSATVSRWLAAAGHDPGAMEHMEPVEKPLRAALELAAGMGLASADSQLKRWLAHRRDASTNMWVNTMLDEAEPAWRDHAHGDGTGIMVRRWRRALDRGGFGTWSDAVAWRPVSTPASARSVSGSVCGPTNSGLRCDGGGPSIRRSSMPLRSGRSPATGRGAMVRASSAGSADCGRSCCTRTCCCTGCLRRSIASGSVWLPASRCECEGRMGSGEIDEEVRQDRLLLDLDSHGRHDGGELRIPGRDGRRPDEGGTVVHPCGGAVVGGGEPPGLPVVVAPDEVGDSQSVPVEVAVVAQTRTRGYELVQQEQHRGARLSGGAHQGPALGTEPVRRGGDH
ncbi:hypothetical protein GCM10023147_36860 [Tsukamurella soli]|uniref:ROS/MUCR transcriptional regulator protein n=1 Tax=Tsukamurella soli TaxID=644556 RepID=A0ABP8K1X5_9ACTN